VNGDEKKAGRGWVYFGGGDIIELLGFGGKSLEKKITPARGGDPTRADCAWDGYGGGTKEGKALRCYRLVQGAEESYLHEGPALGGPTVNKAGEKGKNAAGYYAFLEVGGKMVLHYRK